MAFDATKKEWSEVYVLFRLLADGALTAGTAEGEAGRRWPIVRIAREEHNGTRYYDIEGERVHLMGEEMDMWVARDEFARTADRIWAALKASSDDRVESPEEVEAFLDEVCIYDLEARTDDRTDFYVTFYSTDLPPVGFVVRSRMGVLIPLLDGGRSANLKFEQTGIRFAAPTVNKVNALDTPGGVADRMRMIERLGGVLRYSDVADRVFRGNLSMIDLHFPRLMAEMVRTMHLEGITRTDELVARMIEINPLKIKDELIQKHGFYTFKVKQFLLALAFGMRPAKLYNGTDTAIAGFVMVDGDGALLGYQKAESDVFADYLFTHSRLEKGPTERDKYGYLEKENGTYYLKLNLKIGLTKR